MCLALALAFAARVRGRTITRRNRGAVVPHDAFRERRAARRSRTATKVWNDRPGVAVFDYDRDGDLDLYVTAEAEHANWLYRNEGDGTFANVARSAGRHGGG